MSLNKFEDFTEEHISNLTEIEKTNIIMQFINLEKARQERQRKLKAFENLRELNSIYKKMHLSKSKSEIQKKRKEESKTQILKFIDDNSDIFDEETQKRLKLNLNL
jgi:hypothetical protein